MTSSPIPPCPSCPPHAAGGHGCAVYPSSVTDAEWATLEPLLPSPGGTVGRGGRPDGRRYRAPIEPRPGWRQENERRQAAHCRGCERTAARRRRHRCLDPGLRRRAPTPDRTARQCSFHCVGFLRQRSRSRQSCSRTTPVCSWSTNSKLSSRRIRRRYDRTDRRTPRPVRTR